MGSLLIENVPDDVLRRLEREAELRERKVSDVAADRLTDGVRRLGGSLPRRSAAELLALADAVRTGAREAWLTPEFIRAAREDGRA